MNDTGIAVAPLSDGRLQLFLYEERGQITTWWKESTDSDSDWSVPRAILPPRFRPDWPPHKFKFPAVAPLADGRLQLFIWSGTQSCVMTTPDPDAPNPIPADWHEHPLSTEIDWPIYIAAGSLPDGRLQRWSGTNTCWMKTVPTPEKTTNPDDWTDWNTSGGLPPGSGSVQAVAVAPLLDRRLLLWANDSTGRLWIRWMTKLDKAYGKTVPVPKETTVPAPEEAHFSPWVEQPTFASRESPLAFIAAAVLPDGRIQLWAVQIESTVFIGKTALLWTCCSTTTDPDATPSEPGYWSEWVRQTPPSGFSGFLTVSPDVDPSVAAARLPDGRLQLWAWYRPWLYTCWKTTAEPAKGPADAWSDWKLFYTSFS